MSPSQAGTWYMVHVHIHWAIGALGCMGTWYGTWFSASSDVPKNNIDRRRFWPPQGTHAFPCECQVAVSTPVNPVSSGHSESARFFGGRSWGTLLFWDLELGFGDLPVSLTCFGNDSPFCCKAYLLQLSSLHSSMSLFVFPSVSWMNLRGLHMWLISKRICLSVCVVCEMDFVIPLSRVCFHGFWIFVYVSFNVSCSWKHPSSYTCVFTWWDLFQWVFF